jgi:hypothetical protein
LTGRRQPDARASRWPPVLRWLDTLGLDGLERLVLASSVLQRFVLNRHERAFRSLLPNPDALRSITIVGGGLYPRTALVLARIAPRAALTIVDANAAHLELARCFLGNHVALKREVFDPRRTVMADLVVVPLAYVGNRRTFYDAPPAPTVLVHDWIWALHPRSVIVSWLLLKRLNLVVRSEAVEVLTATS